MTCQEAERYIMAYLEGTLPKADMQRLQEHLLTCPTCNSCLCSYERIFQELKACSTLQAPAEFEIQVMQKIVMVCAEDDPIRIYRLQRVRQWLESAGVVLGTGAWLMLSHGRTTQSDPKRTKRTKASLGAMLMAAFSLVWALHVALQKKE